MIISIGIIKKSTLTDKITMINDGDELKSQCINFIFKQLTKEYGIERMLSDCNDSKFQIIYL